MPGRLHDADYALFVSQLTAIRKQKGITQSDLADRLQRPQSYVSKFERLERRLDVAEWREVVRALGEDAGLTFSTADALIQDEDLLSMPNCPDE
ncbi:MAG: helix-turn-helix transcriptional regulator [Pseudomonadota bacterium]|nr:helix-turn-helix transcriptional regulator [Pseudomonadota bacterium]